MTKINPSLLSSVVASLRKKHGKDSAGILTDGGRSEVSEVVSTGIPVLDRYVLGCGGWPVSRVSEVYSEEGGGKTSLLYSSLASVQRDGGVGVLVETENGLNAARAQEFGVDISSLILLEPRTVEEAGEMIADTLSLLKKAQPLTLVGWDSLAATESEAESKQALSDNDRVGAKGASVGRVMRKLAPVVAESRCHLMVINQTREKMGVVFGDKTTTPGGKALKFAASLRVQILGGKSVKTGTEHVGKIVTIMATKNRFAPPYRKARVRLMYDRGWDADWSTLEHAKTAGLMSREELPFYAQDPEGFMSEIERRLGARGWTLADTKESAAEEEDDAQEPDESED